MGTAGTEWQCFCPFTFPEVCMDKDAHTCMSLTAQILAQTSSKIFHNNLFLCPSQWTLKYAEYACSEHVYPSQGCACEIASGGGLVPRNRLIV